MPLHIFLSTWIGTSFDVLPAAKVAKDVVLVFGFLLALAASVRTPQFKDLLKDRLVWLIVAYAGLTVSLALVRPTDTDAEILGVVYNTRFLLFFLYGGLLTGLFDAGHLRRRALQVTMAVATVVLFFGVVQYTFLPDDALTHVGYARENGVLPAFHIDDKPDLERVMSTLRDPNSFGSYVIIPGMIALGALMRWRDREVRRVGSGLLALSLLCLWFSFSRSAWIGFLAATVVLVFLSYRPKSLTPLLKKLALLGLAGMVLLAGTLYALKDTYFVSNVIFHADESTVLEDPNQLRLRFWQESIDGVAQDPIGTGPGTAGLASIRNEVQGTELNENYYLQVASEVGIVGLLLFLAILAVVAYRLYMLGGNSMLATALLASFVGLAITNFLVHIWSNEAVAYTWWGLAGLVIPTTSKNRTKRYNTKK